MEGPVVEAAVKLDTSHIRKGFGHFPTGVAALAATIDGEDHILVVSSFAVGISLDPALVLFAVQHTSGTWPRLREAERIGVSVLGGNQGALCYKLASKDREARTQGVDMRRFPSGAIEFEGAATWMECKMHAVHGAGDHDIVVLEVIDLTIYPDIEPLVFQGSKFRALS